MMPLLNYGGHIASPAEPALRFTPNSGSGLFWSLLDAMPCAAPRHALLRAAAMASHTVIPWVQTTNGFLRPSKTTPTMQTLVDAVRKTGADNVIMLGGLDYANDLTGWLKYKPKDPDHSLCKFITRAGALWSPVATVSAPSQWRPATRPGRSGPACR